MASTPAELADRFRATLVGAVIGDALGAVFEGHPGPVPTQHLDRVCHATDPLSHTDDTAMAHALAESVLFCGELDQDHLARCFVATWERKPGRGYGAGVASLLGRMAAGGRWDELAPAQFGGAGSFGNGAAMRVPALALLAPGAPAVAAELARRSAVVTHTHPVAVDAAAVQAAAIAIALTEPTAERAALVHELIGITRHPRMFAALQLLLDLDDEAPPEEIRSRIGTSIAGDEAVPAAIAAFVAHSYSFADAIRFAISLGGDTDTIASMTGALAGAHLGLAAIPVHWQTRAEGTTKALELADRITARTRCA